MKKLVALAVALLIVGGSAFAGTFRVHYSIRGSGLDVTVQAESSSEARRNVMDMISGAVVTGIHRIK
jgi:hypothetical protein